MLKIAYILLFVITISACGSGKITSRLPFATGINPCTVTDTVEQKQRCSAFRQLQQQDPNFF